MKRRQELATQDLRKWLQEDPRASVKARGENKRVDCLEYVHGEELQGMVTGRKQPEMQAHQGKSFRTVEK